MRSFLVGCAFLVAGSCAALAQTDATPAPDAPAAAAPMDGGSMKPMPMKHSMHRKMMMHHKKAMMHHRKMMMHHKKMMHRTM